MVLVRGSSVVVTGGCVVVTGGSVVVTGGSGVVVLGFVPVPQIAPSAKLQFMMVVSNRRPSGQVIGKGCPFTQM
jgi:hypothetical protein